MRSPCPNIQKICFKDARDHNTFRVRKCNAILGSHFFLVNYDSSVNRRNISGESLFPKGSHYFLVNNDRGSHYLLVKNDRGVIFSGE